MTRTRPIMIGVSKAAAQTVRVRPLRTLRSSSPSSTMILNGPIMTSRISSGFTVDSCKTNGISSFR